jgi:Skp family chaperone for outer membrane proteins
MTLYEIKREIEEAIDAMFASVDEETGEVSEDAVNKLAELNAARDEKLDNIGAYIKNLMAEAEAIKAEEKKLADRRRVIENKVERLKAYVASILGGQKWSSARVAYSFRKSEKVIVDENNLPKTYMVKKVEFAPDKKTIKELLKSGKKIRGAYIEESQNIQIK